MSERAPKRYSDGFVTLQGGMQSGVHPSLINSDQSAFEVNCTNRGGFTTNRPGFKKITLTFEDNEEETTFKEKNVQGAGYFNQPNGTPIIVVSVGGRIFSINPDATDANNVAELTEGDVNAETLPQAWMQQAEDYFVIQNGQSRPFIYDGANLRRSNERDSEVPVGKMMEYAAGRLVVVMPDLRGYKIGDIVGGPTEVIQFTEDKVVNEGGTITVPIEGDITAVKAIAVLDRGTQQGELTVHTANGVVTARIGEPRTTWKSIPFQQVALIKSGALGQNSTVLVNGDMFFRSTDGIRTLAMARRDFQSQWATTPISHEVERIIDVDDTALLQYGWAALFDNRILMTCYPKQDTYRIYNRGLVVLDFDPVSSMGQKTPPQYDGLWTGLQPTAMVVGLFSGRERCFVFHLNEDGENELWEITTNDEFDNDSTRIPSIIESREFNFNAPFNRKLLYGGDLWVDNVVGSVDFDVKFKPDQYPLWVDWHSWTECANKPDCSTDSNECMTLTNYQPQYRPRMQFPQPSDTCVTGNELPIRHGYQFQTRIAWTGRARIQALRVHAQDVQESVVGCRTGSSCTTLEGCNTDPTTYRVS